MGKSARDICVRSPKTKPYNVYFLSLTCIVKFITRNRVIFIWPWKMVSVSVCYKPMDEKIKTWTLPFPAKEDPNMEKALFDWPIMLQYDVKAEYPLISRKFSRMKFSHPSVYLTNQKPCAFLSVRWTNQVGALPFVCCFCFVCASSFQGHTKIALLLNIKKWVK